MDSGGTNNWPPELLVGNTPSANVVVWSVVSIGAMLGSIGALLAASSRWDFLGWHGREHKVLSFRTPGKVALTPFQRACGWFYLLMSGMFLAQTLVGSASQHYRADLSKLAGLDLVRFLPFNIARTWHVQLSIFWVATGFLAIGTFLAPMIAGHEPPGQHWLVYGLLGALTLVVGGSLLGEFAGIYGRINRLWSWFGNQGWEYLDLGRF